MRREIPIAGVFGREVLDSRGNPTVEAEIVLENGISAAASVPSGASTGSFEAFEKRDGDRGRYFGKGVLCAMENISGEISEKISGMNVFDQMGLDKTLIALDGTENKSRLGANAILAVSAAAAKAAAMSAGLPLYAYLGGAVLGRMPVPMMNVINGGAHAGNNIDIQEFMISPVGAESFREGVRWCAEVYNVLKKVVSYSSVGDEGGFAPELDSDEEAVAALSEAVRQAGFEPGRDFKFALDAAATEWYNDSDGLYYLPKRGAVLKASELCDMWQNLSEKYPIYSIEDGCGEEDWDGWEAMTQKLGDKIMLVGDDLFVTNTERIKKGAKRKAGNAVLIKMNQIGTVTETVSAVRTAERLGYKTVISHRSGETEDTFIADLAAALGSEFVKMGAPARSERTAKYNRLMKIETELGCPGFSCKS